VSQTTISVPPPVLRTHVPCMPTLKRLPLMRANGVCGLVYCADHKCSHSIEMSGDRSAEGIRLSDIEDQCVCTACGKRGADVRSARL
jgi:hypothetical protein